MSNRWSITIRPRRKKNNEEDQYIGLEMSRRSSSSSETQKQIQEVVDRMKDGPGWKVIDWDMIETEEEWEKMPIKYYAVVGKK